MSEGMCREYTSINGQSMYYCNKEDGHKGKHVAKIDGVWKSQKIKITWRTK